MEGSVAIETNREALTRIVASLIAMAGLARVGHLPLEGRSADVDAAAETGRRVGSWRQRASAPVITRHVWRTILSLLRPAESAARRLIIAAARGIVVPSPKLRSHAPKPGRPVPPAVRQLPNLADREAFLRRFGIAVTGSAAGGTAHLPLDGGGVAAGDGGGKRVPPAPRIPAFPLFDPPRRLRLKPARRYVPAHTAPRIMFPGLVQPHRLPPPPPPPAPDDLVSAARLGQRLASLAAALHDLPRQARRFARLKARLDAQRAQEPARPRRLSPLRSGPPYGGRLAVWDPTVPRGKHIREVDVILAHAHALADYALAFPDTS